MKQLAQYTRKLKFGKKTSMPDSAKISTREVEISSNSINHQCQNISCKTGVPETILRVSKYGRFFELPYKFLIDQFFKDLTQNRKKGSQDNSFFCFRSLFSIFLQSLSKNHRRSFPLIRKTKLFQR